MAFKHKGFWQCMDTMRDKNVLVQLIKNRKAPLDQKIKKKILIIGGTGFIGYHLVKKTIKLGWDVTSFSINRPKKKIEK